MIDFVDIMCFLWLVAILVRRWLPDSGNLKKSVHLCLQGVALASANIGIQTKFHGTDGVVTDFYSLNSWMGLHCVSVFGAQVCSSTKTLVLLGLKESV